MPTPSSRDVADSHSFTSSTCPDEQAPHSPSSWHPAPPYPIPAHDLTHHITSQNEPLNADDDSGSRSTTMSPGPESSSDGVSRRAGPMTVSRETTEDALDSHKRTESDEMILEGEHDEISEAGTTSTAALQSGERAHNLASGSGRRRLVHGASDKGFPARADSMDDSWALDGLDYFEEGVITTAVGFSNRRLVPTSPSSFLRAGSRFTGTQQSERQVYDVQVDIKHVDLRESFLCGYLRIQGLTEDHPTLTTYFEGEIIGTKYGFMTRHDTWGANDRIDLSHWGKFAAFKPFASKARKGNIVIKDFAQREHIFMRWKEHFLVPDHRVRTINGASFEGFYYICFNQIQGLVSGIYFHSKSEKFQQLELKHVEDKGCFGSMEFR